MSQAELQTQPPPTPDAPPAAPSVLAITFRILTFRATLEDYNALSADHLLFGIVCTWVVGIGRWWDDPTAGPFHKVGLGSVFYVFFLSIVLWVMVKPIALKRLSFLKLFAFVTLTAPPAILYAIPVEMLTGNETALNLNLAFLVVVALWRVAMFWRFLRVSLQLNWLRTYAALFGPLSVFLLLLTWFSIMHLALRHMGGLRATQTVNGTETDVYIRPLPEEPANTIVQWLTGIGVPFALFSLALWLVVSIYVLSSGGAPAAPEPSRDYR
jgi:hypothetical protein